MTDQYDDYDDDDVDEKPQRTDSEWAELRRAKKAKEKAEKELDEMRKQIAFSKAGIDTDDPKTQYFVKAYDGEVSADAIRAEAIKAGFLSEPTDDPNPQALADSAAVADAGSGAVPEGGVNVSYGALDQAFTSGGVEGMMTFLRENGVPINEVQ